MAYKKIRLKDIHFGSERLPDVTPLSSNKTQPIIVSKRKDGKYKIHDGYGRANGLLNDEQTHAHAIEVDDDDLKSRGRSPIDDPDWVSSIYEKYTPHLEPGEVGSVMRESLYEAIMYHNDHLSIDENVAIRQQKLAEDLSCPPLPLREARGVGPRMDGAKRDTYPGTAGSFEHPDFNAPDMDDGYDEPRDKDEYHGPDEDDPYKGELMEDDETDDDDYTEGSDTSDWSDEDHEYKKQQYALYKDFKMGLAHGKTGRGYDEAPGEESRPKGSLYHMSGYKEGMRLFKASGKPAPTPAPKDWSDPSRSSNDTEDEL